MDGRGGDEEALTVRIEQLQKERDELRKDIEQLCMQQAGPSYLAVATRMHFQRTAGLEQEINSLRKKIAGLEREKHNLQEELCEAYRIKTQLADLHCEEVLKNKEAEKQVKFFQSCVADAFSERDHSLMELEKAKEQEEAMCQKLNDSEYRLAELQSAFQDEKKCNSALQMELKELKEKNLLFEKIVNKFFAVRERDGSSSVGNTWQDKCAYLLDDPSDSWVFSSNSVTSTSKYIASLEAELGTLRNKINKLESNLRMGLEIEQHIKRSMQSLERKQNILDNMIENGLSKLRGFHQKQRLEVVKLLEEGTSHLKSVLTEVQSKLSQLHASNELKFVPLQREDCDYTECRDVHISTDSESSVRTKKSGHPTLSWASNRKSDALDPLSQALQEKVSALLLLSQQEERHLLERDVNAALQKKIEELQRNLSQVANEKVKALLELAELKREYQLLWENNSHLLKHSSVLADSAERSNAIHEREGKLKNLLKRTYLRRWMGKDFIEDETYDHEKTDGSSTTNKRTNSSMDFARLKVENAALQESMANMDHLTSSIHRLHVSLLKAREDATSAGALSSIIEESNHVRTALGSSLAVSWSAEESPGEGVSGRGDPVSAAGFEMVELLILAAQLLKEQLVPGLPPS